MQVNSNTDYSSITVKVIKKVGLPEIWKEIQSLKVLFSIYLSDLWNILFSFPYLMWWKTD